MVPNFRVISKNLFYHNAAPNPTIPGDAISAPNLAHVGAMVEIRQAVLSPIMIGMDCGMQRSAVELNIAVLSVWILIAALRTLGKQWAVAARVIQGHELITSGPYHLVRNPIYAGMFGMLIATGVAASQWWAVALGMILFWYGTQFRIGVEEKLLRETF